PPDDHGACRKGLSDLERVRLARVRAGEELKDGVFPGRDMTARPGDVLDDGAVAGTCLLDHSLPAGRASALVDPEATWRCQLDLRGREGRLFRRYGKG